MSRDHQDALMDQMLRELLGGDRPRDMTARVLAQAKIYDRFRRRWWVSAVTAVAASMALAASLYLFWPQKYPRYEATGVTLVNSNEVHRGTVLTTDEITTGNINIGDYVWSAMQPLTTLTLGGGKYQEKVFLDQGELQVAVKKNKGQFDVVVGPTTVHVTGTKFNVNVLNDETTNEQRKKLLVSVTEGSVEIQGIPGLTGIERLSAGDEKEFVIFYTPKNIPPVNTSLRGGLLAAAQEGARTGNRGGAVGRPENAPARAALARGNKPLQIILYPGTTPQGGLAGVLRRQQNVYFLETKQGANVYMFDVTAPGNQNWTTLPLGKPVRAFLTDGKVTDIVTPKN